jgi:hypothetical protein
MGAFRFFDPWASLDDADVTAKAANVAKQSTERKAALANLAALAGSPPNATSFGASSDPPIAPSIGDVLATEVDTKTQRAAIIEQEGAIPRVGIPEIPHEPVLLQDGRRIWRFSEAQDCTADQAAVLIDQAHWCGAVLVADGRELIVVERWLSSLPLETLCELSRCANAVIAALHQHLRVRCQADPRSRGEQ